MVKLNRITELTEIPGFSSLNADGQRAVKLAVDAAKGAKLNSANQIKVDPVRLREGANAGEVLVVLHSIEDINIRTKDEPETGKRLVIAIPDVTVRASLVGSNDKNSKTYTGSTEYQDLFKEIFGRDIG